MRRLFTIFVGLVIFFQTTAKTVDDNLPPGRWIRNFAKKTKNCKSILLLRNALKGAEIIQPKTPPLIAHILDSTLLTTQASLIPWIVPAAIAEGLGIPAIIACCSPYVYLLSIKNAAASMIDQNESPNAPLISNTIFQSKFFAIYGD